MLKTLPIWLKQEIPDESVFNLTHLISEFGVRTVCKEAKCPNMPSCFKNKNATFMILGKDCTRNCRFCNIGVIQENPFTVDFQEPERLAELVKLMHPAYVVITSVSRDDLADGGASVFAETIRLIKALNYNIKIEVLVPDFRGKESSIRAVVGAGPQVFGHNLETVNRLYSEIRPQASYELSLSVLKKAKEAGNIITKSSLILGLGETHEEVLAAMKDLYSAGCDILTLGQYLAPSPQHYPVKEFISPELFEEYRQTGLRLGFKAVLSGPKVRSSYLAEDIYKEAAHV